MATFSFHNQQTLEFQLAENIQIVIERVGFAVARLYFTQDEIEVAIPEGLGVMDITNGHVRVFPLLDRSYFILCWTDNYKVQYQTQTVYLTTQRIWKVEQSEATLSKHM